MLGLHRGWLFIFYKNFVIFKNFRFSYLSIFSHIDMKKPSSEIGIRRILGEAEAEGPGLSQRMVFSYLYEKKMPNMKIENFKKSQKFYKKITNHLRCNPSTRQGKTAK